MIEHLLIKRAWLQKVLVTAIFTATVAACGGSGGVAGVSYTLPTVPTDPVQVTTGNYQAVASDAVSATVGAMEAGYGGPSGVVVSGSGQVVMPDMDAVIRRTNRILMEQRDASSMPAGVSLTLNCFGSDNTYGTITLTAIGNDSRVDYNNCDFGGNGLAVVDGALAATHVSYTGNQYAPPFSFSATYSYDLFFSYNSGAEVVAMMGRFNYSMADSGSSYTSTTSNGEMGIVSGAGSLVLTNMSRSQSCDSHLGYDWDYECVGTLTFSNNYTAAGTLSNGSFTVTTTTPLVVDTSVAIYPKSGAIQVDGSNNSRIIITILDDEWGSNSSVNDLEVYVDPDTTVAGGEATFYFTWASIFA